MFGRVVELVLRLFMAMWSSVLSMIVTDDRDTFVRNCKTVEVKQHNKVFKFRTQMVEHVHSFFC